MGKRRKSLSLVSNIMSDLGLTDVQKLFAVLAISWFMIALKMWLRNRPAQKKRLAERKAAQEARRAKQQRGYAELERKKAQKERCTVGTAGMAGAGAGGAGGADGSKKNS